MKVEGWEQLSSALPLDYDAHHPPCGNQHRSSYVRLGFEQEPEWISETHERLNDILKKRPDILKGKTTMCSYGNYSE